MQKNLNQFAPLQQQREMGAISEVLVAELLSSLKDTSENFCTDSTGQHGVVFRTSRLSIIDSARLDLCDVLFSLTH